MAHPKGSRALGTLFATGYPYPINLFVSLMVVLLPASAPLMSSAVGDVRQPLNYALAGGLALLYLVVWSRVRVYESGRSSLFYRIYLLVQTLVVSVIYVLDGGLTRFLFVVVAVQAVYITPVRGWAPFLGTLGALWLVLYLVISPYNPGSTRVIEIGMYLLYLIFAALVTFTTVQQERQVKVAGTLLSAVDERHEALRAYDLVVEQLAEVQERERLAQTIYSALVQRLSQLSEYLERLLSGEVPLERDSARRARLEAKEALNFIRQAVKTLRPGSDGELEDDDQGLFGEAPEPVISVRRFDPIRIYHVWNIGVIVISTGVILAGSLVGETSRWLLLLILGILLLGAYTGAALAIQPRTRTLYLMVQAGLISMFIWLSDEPLASHLFLIVAAQIVFLVPLMTRWLVSAVVFPTLLTALALWATQQFEHRLTVYISLTAAFGVTYLFNAVMAFMTRRQVEARQQALMYAEQMAEVNRLLELRLQEVRRMVIARERIRLSREIHDHLGHHLTTVIVELQYAEQLPDEDRRGAVQHLRSARQVIGEAMKSSRELFEVLGSFDQPLPEALQELVDGWKQRHGVNVYLSISGDFSTLSTAVRITLYRVAQESLTNIQKHARARNVEIDLRKFPDRVSMSISNDQTGEPPSGEGLTGGFGLTGLRERADALQGEFQAFKRPSGGFQVKVVLPLGA